MDPDGLISNSIIYSALNLFIQLVSLCIFQSVNKCNERGGRNRPKGRGGREEPAEGEGREGGRGGGGLTRMVLAIAEYGINGTKLK